MAALVLLVCSAALCQALPPPTAVRLTDDPEDDKGDRLLLSWGAPADAAPSGRALVGYRVFVQTGHEQAKVQELIPDAAAGDTKLTDLKPWRKYQAGVTAVYAPAAVEFAPDEHAPDSLAEGVSESRMVLAGPVAPHGKWFKADQTNVLVTSLLIVAIVIATIVLARRRDMYIRPIAGLRAVDDAIGRATEMASCNRASASSEKAAPGSRCRAASASPSSTSNGMASRITILSSLFMQIPLLLMFT